MMEQHVPGCFFTPKSLKWIQTWRRLQDAYLPFSNRNEQTQ